MSGHPAPPAEVDPPLDPSGGRPRQPVASGLPQRFLRNVAANYVVAGATAVSAVLVTPIALHHLGAPAYGVYALSISLVGYLQLLSFGFGGVTTKVIAEDAFTRPQRALETINTSLAVTAVLGLLAGAAGVVLAAGAPRWFDLPAGLEHPAQITILVLALAMAVAIPCDNFGGVLTGFQRYDLAGVANVALVVLTGVGTIAVIEGGGGLVAIAVVVAVVSVLLHPLRWLLVRRVMPGARLAWRYVDRARIVGLARLSSWFLVGGIADVIAHEIDLVVVGAILGIKAVAIFAIGSKLAQLTQKALGELGSVFLPHASALAAEGQGEQLDRVLIDGVRTTLLVGVPLALIMGILARAVVTAWVGPGYGAADDVLIVFSGFSVCRALLDVPEGIMIGTGRLRPWGVMTVAQAAVNLAVSIALAERLGLVGVALGTLVGTGLVLLPAAVVTAGRIAGTSLRRFVSGAVVPHLVPAALLAGLLWLLRGTAGSGRIGLFAVAGLGLVVYAGAYLLVGATATERAHVRVTVGLGPGKGR